jgi:Fe-Mn family superoxide dismutase
MKYTLPKLNYSYQALEPYIDELTMTIHHSKHHQAYVDNLNAALDKHPELYEKSLPDLLKNIDDVPTDIRQAVKNNGGGVYNHNFFWQILKKNPDGQPKGALMDAIARDFGSFAAFKEAFIASAKSRFGSGWAWLIVNPQHKLEIVSTPNQDAVFHLGTPILTLDVWEHAYYLRYQNRRPDYINAFFQIIDWDAVSDLFLLSL